MACFGAVLFDLKNHAKNVSKTTLHFFYALMRRNSQPSRERRNASLQSRPPFYPVSSTRQTIGIRHNGGRPSPLRKKEVERNHKNVQMNSVIQSNLNTTQ